MRLYFYRELSIAGVMKLIPLDTPHGPDALTKMLTKSLPANRPPPSRSTARLCLGMSLSMPKSSTTDLFLTQVVAPLASTGESD